MFHIVTPDGITVTETGCQTIFVPKTHEDYDEILKNINEMDYWQVQSYVDTKCRLQSLISDDAEAYFNENDDFEVLLNGLSDAQKGAMKDLVASFLEKILEDRGEDDKQIQKVIKTVRKLEVAKVKVAFE